MWNVLEWACPRVNVIVGVVDVRFRIPGLQARDVTGLARSVLLS